MKNRLIPKSVTYNKFKRHCLKTAAALILCTLLCSCGYRSKGDKLAMEGFKKYDAHDYAAAIELFEQAEESGLKSITPVSFYTSYGDALYRMDCYEESIRAHSIALGHNEKLFMSWVTIGICQSKLGDDNAAINAYARALEYDPHDSRSVSLYISLGNFFISENKPYAAIRYLELANEIYPEHPAVHAYLALSYAMAGEKTKSSDELQLAAAYGYNQLYEIRDKIVEVSSKK